MTVRCLSPGDIVFGRYPNIDFLYGGSIDGDESGASMICSDLPEDDTRSCRDMEPVGTKAIMRSIARCPVESARSHSEIERPLERPRMKLLAAKPSADYDAKFDFPDARA